MRAYDFSPLRALLLWVQRKTPPGGGILFSLDEPLRMRLLMDPDESARSLERILPGARRPRQIRRPGPRQRWHKSHTECDA